MANTKMVVNCETGEVQILDLTADEIAQREIDAQADIDYKAKVAAEEKAKSAAKVEIATRLGLSADDLATLLG